MKFFNIIKIRTLISLLSLFAFFACSEDKVEELATNQGKVVFQFTKINVYEVDDMGEIGSIIVTIEKDGIRQTLPSMEVMGAKDSLYTSAINLEAGTYKVVGYKIFGQNASKIADIDMDKDNELIVKEGTTSLFDLFVEIKVIYDRNLIRNVMIGICKEVFGNDQSKWPIDTKEEDLRKWPCFEFVKDEVTDQIQYLSVITFDKSFMGMKKLPSGLSSLATVEALTFRDFDLEELPEDISKMPSLHKMTIINTSLKKLPKSLGESKIIDFTVQNTDITEYPVELCNLEKMRVLDIMGNKLTTIPQEIGNYKNMVQLRLCENGISELPDVFAGLEKLDHLDLSGCQLKSFPESLTEARRLKSIFMEDCGLTHIPGVIGRAKQLHWVILSNNNISSVEPSVFATDAKLNTIFLSGNPISELPVLPLPNLQMIAINNCQFTAVPDLSNYSKLIQFEMQNNPFTTIPEGFLKGTSLTKLILSDNAQLTTVPADLGVDLVGDVPATLFYVNIENCPKLNWTAPAAWGSAVMVKR